MGSLHVLEEKHLRILVLTENGIEEKGTHEEPLAKGGVYAGLYAVQFN